MVLYPDMLIVYVTGLILCALFMALKFTRSRYSRPGENAARWVLGSLCSILWPITLALQIILFFVVAIKFRDDRN